MPTSIRLHLDRRAQVVLLALFCWLWCTTGQALAQGSPKLNAGYASITGSRIVLWSAQEMGFFRRQGLQTELIFIASSSRGIPALIAGEVAIFSGAPETAAQATVQGADLVLIASEEPTPYKLIAQPGIKTVEQLKGKKIGIDRIGGSSYYATRRFLDKLGLQPQDVEFMQITGGGSERVAAFRSGVLSGIVSTVARFDKEKVPYRILGDALEMGIRSVGGAFVTTRSYRDRNRDQIQKFVRGLVEAAYWAKNPKNQQGVFKVLSHFLRLDNPSSLELNYRLYVPAISPFPYTEVENLRSTLWDLVEANPKLKELNLRDFVDNSFIRNVEQEGIEASR